MMLIKPSKQPFICRQSTVVINRSIMVHAAGIDLVEIASQIGDTSAELLMAVVTSSSGASHKLGLFLTAETGFYDARITFQSRDL
jgi:Ni2+-binding GTPase involved in maturation of urease and hydrogenase